MEAGEMAWTKTCKWCKRRFVPPINDRLAEFCSDTCEGDHESDEERYRVADETYRRKVGD